MPPGGTTELGGGSQGVGDLETFVVVWAVEAEVGRADIGGAHEKRGQPSRVEGRQNGAPMPARTCEARVGRPWQPIQYEPQQILRERRPASFLRHPRRLYLLHAADCLQQGGAWCPVAGGRVLCRFARVVRPLAVYAYSVMLSYFERTYILHIYADRVLSPNEKHIESPERTA